ncbi:phosphoenolpyruvate synthase [Shewanella putrefaciens]|nr:phosphoenolpyruvate synthase [Shewanella putrefaciens]
MSEQTIRFGTKSETLARLGKKVRCSQVLPLIYFTEKQWISDHQHWLRQMAALPHQGQLIIRSSAQNEDAANDSMAGAFTSCLNVPINNENAIVSAVNRVIDSFIGHENEGNQVLVQPMLTDIQMSGVVMTHDLQQGSPYYIVNYDDESGLTDTITGGIGIQKTVLIYRDTDMALVRSSRLKAVIRACREVERLCGNIPLDIEFAVDCHETVYLLQTRRISLFTTWHPVTERRVSRQLIHVSNFLTQYLSVQSGIYGQRSILGVMPDWNPAEIIGSTPRPLASSLYRLLITDTIWRESRALMGYHHPRDQHLMVMIGHHPYIDVRLSFNSFLPSQIPSSIADKLVDAWLDRLKLYPQWHDKVEFEIVQTCYDFCFTNDFASRYPDLLSETEFQIYKQSLSSLTQNAIKGVGEGSVARAMADIKQLVQIQNVRAELPLSDDLYAVRSLLLTCSQLGTKAFAVLARHAFIAEALLRSARRCNAITEERINEFKQSIHTISTNLTQDYASVIAGSLSPEIFLRTFGHLRPGTYDITSLRYDERSDLFDHNHGDFALEGAPLNDFIWTDTELKAIQLLIDECQWSISSDELLEYAASAIQAREYAKFIFTKDLSDVLAMLTQWGSKVGLSRDDLSFLNIHRVLDSLTVPLLDDVDRIWLEQVNQATIEYQQAALLKLGHLITCAEDVFIVPLHRAMANYITHKSIEAPVCMLEKDTPVSSELKGKIICIENADPGYDWIFTRAIAGLITQFGGANSHMAIRCAEFGIPAAIGCGEQIFSRLTMAKKVVLNCRDKTLNLV